MGTFSQIVQAQETYAIDPAITCQSAFDLWCARPSKTYVFESRGDLLGSYYLKANGKGPSAHVCNCGYMVKAAFQGQGIAQTLCEHSQAIAIELGFKAMQFNSVVSPMRLRYTYGKSWGTEYWEAYPRAISINS